MKNYTLTFILLFTVIFSKTFSQDIEPITKSNQDPVLLTPGIQYDYGENYNYLDLNPSVTGNGTEPGNTPGELDVTASGGATYTIPIEVPDGINGVHPELSLTYNSQSGNGTAGYGWNVGSVSTISRTSSTMFHDDYIEAVNGKSDRFLLDGERLMLVEGTHGAHNSVYTTENESNIKVKVDGCRLNFNDIFNCTNPVNFKVYYPDGSIAVYGISGNDGTVNFDHQSRNRESWAISYYITPSGNKITYQYIENNGALYIDKIRYAYVDSNHLSEVDFKYASRVKSEFYYVNGQKLTNSLILKEINVKNDDEGYRNYELEHDTNDGNYERLVQLTELSGDGEKSYNPTEFTYFDNDLSEDMSYNVYDSGFETINRYNAVPLVGDLNANGTQDQVFYDPNDKSKYHVLFSGYETNMFNDTFTESFQEILMVNALDPNEKLLPNDAICIVKGDETEMSFKVNGISNVAAQVNQMVNLYTKDHNFRSATAFRPNPADCTSDGGIGFDPDPYGTQVFNDNEGLPLPPELPLPPIELPGDGDDDGDDDDDDDDFSLNTIELDIPKLYLSGDFNGDGLSDILVLEKTFSYVHQYCTDGQISNSDPIHITPKSYLVELDRRKTEDFVSETGEITGINNSTKVLTADYTGDGKTDLLVLNSGVPVQLYNYSNTSNEFELVNDFFDENLNNALNNEYPVLLGDFNGDGLADICVPDDTGSSKWHFYFSSSNGDFERQTSNNSIQYVKDNPFSSTWKRNYFALDIDEDGKSDIFRIDFEDDIEPIRAGIPPEIVGYNINKKTHIYRSINRITENSLNFQTTYQNYDLHYFNIQNNLSSQPTAPLITFSNDLSTRYLTNIDVIQNGKMVRFKNTKNHQEEMLLRQVTRGNGIKETIHYGALENDDDHFPTYSTNFEEVFPFVSLNYTKQMKVVKQLQINAYNGYEKFQDFRYRDAVINTEGLGFIGFKALHKSNWYNDDIQKHTNISEYDPDLRGALKRSVSVSGDLISIDNLSISQIPQLLSYNLIDCNSEVKPNGVFSLKSNKSIEANLLEDVLIYNEIVEFDTYNNITKSLKKVYPFSNDFNIENPPSSNLAQQVSTELTYQNNSSLTSTDSYYIGMPLTKETKTNNGNTPITDYNEYEYNSELLIDKHTYWRDDSDKVIETNDFDSYGNLIEKKIITQNDGERIKEFKYDTSYRFIEETIEIDGTSTYYTYDSVTELLLFELDHLGNEMNYEYDEWGNLILETDNFGVTTTHNYTNINSNLEIHTLSSDGSEEIILYDALGREIEKSTKNINGQFSKIIKTYDDNDLVTAISEPFEGSSANQWSTIEYDDFGRPAEVNYASGKSIAYTYNGLEVVEDDGVNPKTTTKNQLDEIIELTDNGGTVFYEYRADGNLKQSVYDDVIISFEYDNWGRKTKMSDPSAGVYKYEYNQFGEVTKEETPNGRTHYVYDNPTGVLLEEVIIGENTETYKQYRYNAVTKLVSEINMIDDVNGIENNYLYNYDSNGRIESINEDLHDGVRFRLENEYNQLNQLSKIHYYANKDGISSSTQVEYDYTYGTLTEIKNPEKSQALWKLNEVDERGNATKFLFGNSTQANVEYDDFGFPFKIKHSHQDLDVIDFTYNFNTAQGILTSRTSINPLWEAWTENFMHDNQNQLTQATDEQHTLENSYDSKARITQNLQVGEYNYNSNGSPYQLKNISLNEVATEKFLNKPKQQIKYNAFKSPTQIREYFDLENEENVELIDFTYNAFDQRSSRYYNGNSNDKYERRERKYYSSIAPIEIKQNLSTNENNVIYYLGGDAYQAPVAYEDSYLGNEAIEDRFLYLHRDYLGTIFSITTDANAGGGGQTASPKLVERRHFDAWGGLVMLQKEDEQEAEFFNDSRYDAHLYLDRGYTGHEHMASASLIHMNGRMYDAKLRRFLAPDNFIQDPYNTQNYNRYAYAYNNPLIYNDPSGELIFTAIAVVATAYLGLSAINGSFNPSKWDTGSQIALGIITFATIGPLVGPAIAKVGAAIGNAVAKSIVWAAKGVATGAKWVGKKVALSIEKGNLLGNMLGGTLNAAYNWDSSNPLKSLAYFSAGFLGTAIGAGSEKVWIGMVSGGSLTVGAAWGANDLKGRGTLYRVGQKFVGGALSSLTGMQAFKKSKGLSKSLKQFKDDAGYLFGNGSKVWHNKVLSYGIQSTATDFAYSDRKYFTRRSWNTHLNTFIFGAVNGAMQYESKQLFSERWIGYGMDYFAQSINQGYNPFDYSKGWRKTGIFSLKAYGFTN